MEAPPAPLQFDASKLAHPSILMQLRQSPEPSQENWYSAMLVGKLDPQVEIVYFPLTVGGNTNQMSGPSKIDPHSEKSLGNSAFASTVENPVCVPTPRTITPSQVSFAGGAASAASVSVVITALAARLQSERMWRCVGSGMIGSVLDGGLIGVGSVAQAFRARSSARKVGPTP